MTDKENKKTLAETLYKTNIFPLPVMPTFDKELIMKRLEEPPLSEEEKKSPD